MQKNNSKIPKVLVYSTPSCPYCIMAKEFLNNYQWSSHGYYTGQREKEPVINHKEFPEYFEEIRCYA